MTFGAFITGVATEGGKGSEDRNQLTSSYGLWYYNGKFSDLGISNYYISDGDYMCWGIWDVASGWNYGVLRYHFTDSELAETYNITSVGDVKALMDAGNFYSTFPNINFGRYGQFKELSADELAAIPVIEKINAIGTVTLDSETAITEARAAYAALATDGQKAAVKNYDVLLSAEETLAALKAAAENPTEYSEALNGALNYLGAIVTNPTVGSQNGEWAVLALARSGRVDAQSTFTLTYLSNLDAALAAGNEITAETDYQRVTLALTALGLDASAYKSQNLTASYSAYDGSMLFNAKIFGLLALNSKPYTTSATNEYIAGILAEALPNGGWNLYGNGTADVDVTAMAIQALAPYYGTRTDVTSAIDTALTVLHGLQDDATGGFNGYDEALSTSSTAQVVTALTALGINPASEDWAVTGGNTPMSALVTFYNKDYGYFGDTTTTLNQMATEQAAYALVAYDRLLRHENSLYSMADAFVSASDNSVAVATAKQALGAVSLSVGMTTANTEADVKAWAESEIAKLDLHGVAATVTMNNITPAIAGTAADTDGTAGSFSLTVELSKGRGTRAATDSLTISTGVITPTEYVFSNDAGISSVSVNGKPGVISGTSINVVLDYSENAVLPTTPSAISIVTHDTKATYSEPATTNAGATWTFTVTAENNNDTANYTINVSIAANPAAAAEADVAAAKSAIGSAMYTVPMAIANTDNDIQTWLESQIASNNGVYNVSVSVSVYDVSPAVAGTYELPSGINGINGSFTFDVTLEKGYDGGTVTDHVYGIDGVITATPYVLSSNKSVTSITVNSVAATVGSSAYNYNLALGYGQAPASGNAFVITLDGARASHSVPSTADDGETWTFTVTAEDGSTANYTIAVTVGENPAADNANAILAAKIAISNASYTYSMGEAPTADAVKALIETKIATLSLNGVNVTVSVDSFTAATQTATGSFTFTATLSKGSGSSLANGTVTVTKGV
jgi:hypothetical protein